MNENEFGKLQTPPRPIEENEDWNKSVLLADDNNQIREMTVKMLKRMGCTVEEVDNGKKFVDRLNTAKPGEFGLAITDIEMPEMDGMQALAIIRADSRFNQLPLIVYSGDIENEEKNMETVRTSGDVYLTKPFGVLQLKEKITMALASKSGK